ncbi:MAG: sugar phosphate isomerase/epimerase family protein [Planctomycetota bacterium]
MKRRELLKLGTMAAISSALSGWKFQESEPKKTWLKLAVQQYSFNRQLRSSELKIEDYPATVVEGTGIKSLEFFNGHIEDKKYNEAFFVDLKKRCDDLEANTTMMLCRSKPAVDSPDPAIRQKAIEGYKRWLTATQILGGQYIRVDTRHKGDAEEQKKYAVAGLKALTEVASEYGIGILVENHGGHSSNGAWLADVMRKVNLPNCGTLPDFQNFKDYDPYKGVAEMMPWAKILCAKAKAFDDQGNETNVDYRRMLKIAKDAGFRGFIGIEFEGHEIEPLEGIKMTAALIEKIQMELA